MKKIFSLYKSYMIRPILYKCVTKCAVTLTLVLLWNRYLNTGTMLVVRDGFFAAALVLFGAVWISFLKLDGMKVHYVFEERKKKPRRRHGGDLVDFVDEHIVSFDELDDVERVACGLASNAISCALFLVPALIALVC